MSNNSTSGNIGFTGLLTIVFIVLKLTDVINWSWWWVLSPIWIPVAAVLIGLGIYFIYWINKNDEREKPVQKSRWQQRMDEMKAKQETMQNTGSR